MAAQTVRNHKDRPRHNPTADEGPSGFQKGSSNLSAWKYCIVLTMYQGISQTKTQTIVPLRAVMDLRDTMGQNGKRDRQKEYDGRKIHWYVNIYM